MPHQPLFPRVPMRVPLGPGAFGLAAAYAVTLGLTGCGSVAGLRDAPLPAAGEADAYWALVLRDHAINLSVAAPTNTVQLEATAVTADGWPVPGVTAAPTYTVQDTAVVTVSPTGVLTAHQPAEEVQLIATWSSGGVTHMDTAHVRVTATAPAAPLATFSIQPAPGDSAKWSFSKLLIYSYSGGKRIVPTARDTSGVPISDLAVAYTSSNPQRAPIDARTGGFGFFLLPGQTVLTASTYAYGVRARDTLPFVIGLPTFGDVGIAPPPTAGRVPTLTLGVGALVTFSNGTQQPVTVRFDDSAAVSAPSSVDYPSWFGTEGGNIVSLARYGSANRQFNTPGEYRYRDQDGRLLGVLVIRAD